MPACRPSTLVRAALALLAVLAAFQPEPARAEIALSQIIVDFEPDQPLIQDIEIQNRDAEKAYVEVAVARVANPGEWPMRRETADNPAELGLIATPARFVLAPNGARLIRLIATEPGGEAERIYRVSVVPKVGEVTDQRSGVKVVVGYEVLVIVRPKVPRVELDVRREGKVLVVRNTGNTNVLIPTVRQCPTPADCRGVNGTRVYAGRTERIELPLDMPAEALFSQGRRTWTQTY